ncbi:pro-neuregulin-4, membrane-bound isoform [Nothobranchius furzeri]|uniref:pro-neuregulin-4, membrane-bound isoform n=1 Tax=Nothobranchius furzeri TaxID=105023 RepID=UPI002403AEE3|nr:pro-neuregulin-4, membrane-bound isoform-like [Nothobranchius furzeri]
MAEHGKPCDVQEATYCMNGATCYKIPSMDSLSCVCTESYKGSRCDQLYLFNQSLDETNTGLLAAVILLAILISVVLVFLIYRVYRILKSRGQSQQSQQEYRKAGV